MINKPIKRSNLRIMLGKAYYRTMRYKEWYFGEKKYAHRRSDLLLSNVVFEHKTPLYRSLKNVDMWLQDNKVINLKFGAKALNGVVIEPGEFFSYWKLLGKPTYSKGYVDGMVLHYGKVKTGVGGGLCQLSNLIYWMTLHTPLTVTERHRHSYDVFPDSKRSQPFGSGATCVYNYRDLQIVNNTNKAYQLIVKIEGDHLYGEWRSMNKPIEHYEVYEKHHEITHETWGGYARHNQIFRRVRGPNDEVLEESFLIENHALMMYQPFIESK